MATARLWRPFAQLMALLAVLLTLPLPSFAAGERGERIDPLKVADDDFARHRDPALWEGLSVTRIVFREGRATWRLWRIVNQRRPDGPLWAVPHDDENAAFSAALLSLKAWGGVAMVVDTGPADGSSAARYNATAGWSRRIDPNRHFRADAPDYVTRMLADLAAEDGRPPRVIIALHTNPPGVDVARTSCPGAYPPGSGEIAISMCNDRFHPWPSVRRGWPFDDDDSLVVVPHLMNALPEAAWCARRLASADMNILYERVAVSDGSLSNYAVQHGLDYVNLETEDRGNDPAGLAAARQRLVRMADMVMERCAPLPGIVMRPVGSR